MDWSLVLVSQGIVSTVIQPGEEGGWALLVEERDCGRALGILRQYKLENRNRLWGRTLGWPGGRFNWWCLGWAGALGFWHWAASILPKLRAAGVMDSGAVLGGEWWRLFTAMELHADLGHLAANLSLGVVLLGLVMARYGTWVGLLASYLAGAGGNVVSLMLNRKPFEGLGASGMVMGALGLLAAQAFVYWKAGNRSWKPAIGGLAAGLMLLVLYGLSPEADVAAHLGGFLAGLAPGLAGGWWSSAWISPARRERAAGLALGALVLGTWWLALR